MKKFVIAIAVLLALCVSAQATHFRTRVVVAAPVVAVPVQSYGVQTFQGNCDSFGNCGVQSFGATYAAPVVAAPVYSAPVFNAPVLRGVGYSNFSGVRVRVGGFNTVNVRVGGSVFGVRRSFAGFNRFGNPTFRSVRVRVR